MKPTIEQQLDSIFTSRLYRWSRLCRVDDRWHVTFNGPNPDLVYIRRWRWFRPDDWARLVMHKLWARRYW